MKRPVIIALAAFFVVGLATLVGVTMAGSSGNSAKPTTSAQPTTRPAECGTPKITVSPARSNTRISRRDGLTVYGSVCMPRNGYGIAEFIKDSTGYTLGKNVLEINPPTNTWRSRDESLKDQNEVTVTFVVVNKACAKELQASGVNKRSHKVNKLPVSCTEYGNPTINAYFFDM